MGRGRAPAWILDPDQPGVVQQDARPVDRRGRITIPLRLLEGLPGVDEKGAGLVLIESRHPGRAVLREWASAGEEVLRRRKALIAAAAGAVEQVRLLDDVFRRGRLETGGRLDIPAPVLAHLSSAFRLKGVFVVRYLQRLELWSRAYRTRRLADAPELEHDDALDAASD